MDFRVPRDPGQRLVGWATPGTEDGFLHRRKAAARLEHRDPMNRACRHCLHPMHYTPQGAYVCSDGCDTPRRSLRLRLLTWLWRVWPSGTPEELLR